MRSSRSLAPLLLSGTSETRSRSAFFSAVLAVIALFGVIALTGWHNAIVHDEDAIHLSVIEHRHTPPKQADPDAPIHLIAHAIAQWVSTSGPFTTPIVTVTADQTWSALDASFRSGIDPAELLRPPRR